MVKRIEKIMQKIASDKIDALYVTSPHNISYLTNLFPSTIEEREYYLLITANNAYIMAPKMFMMAIAQQTKGFVYIEITSDKGLYENILEICKKENIKSLGFERDNLLYKEFSHLSEKLGKIETIELEDFIENERQIKDKDEIEKIKMACQITDICYKEVLLKLENGITEREIAAGIEFYFNQSGGNAFKPIVAFGKNSAIPHHISDDTKLTRNSFVLLDFGAKFEGYCADMSRTIYFGNPSDKEKKMYRTVLEAQELALEKLNEWRNKDFEVSHLHTLSESHIENSDFPSFPHSLGHGIGLEVHELPSISKYSEEEVLQSSMVITVEPAIYVKDLGGVRIEDDVLLTDDGFEILTKSPKQLTVIE